MNATAETRVNAAPCRTDGRVGQASSLSAPNRQDASPTPTHWVSWKAPFRFSASIGTMNQIGAPLPALSPQGGERVAEGRERGGSWRAKQSFDYLSGEGGGAFVPLALASCFSRFRSRRFFNTS